MSDRLNLPCYVVEELKKRMGKEHREYIKLEMDIFVKGVVVYGDKTGH